MELAEEKKSKLSFDNIYYNVRIFNFIVKVYLKIIIEKHSENKTYLFLPERD